MSQEADKLKSKSGIVFGKNLMECEFGEIRVIMNKSICLGQTSLDLSEIIIYEFHYDHMKLKYGTNLPLGYMDTDCLIYDIKTNEEDTRPCRLQAVLIIRQEHF